MIDGMKIINGNAVGSNDTEKAVRPLYREIMKAIKQDGIAVCQLFGKVYEFNFIDDFFGVELFIDGKYDCDLTNGREVAELLVDVYENYMEF